MNRGTGYQGRGKCQGEERRKGVGMKMDWRNNLGRKTRKEEWKEENDNTIWTEERKKLFCLQSSTNHALVAV
jgi:hypothetical protein